ncbi:hypothetical protein SYNTR_0986 [Candidatus Syntrophocurvum alkaliphilum]|uniref:Succinylglutamate desuccinylase/Aspartoacylase catalytic domain-containing protein n=1 Tax=Candidatus Syntrophocurvum alkaliphilum TaxID=2293317 RepID=A0A6I6DB88_9FIRM|nr:succinylglutamate desuccinylase/aspartoacylase family protein [Candidatus Syntrophocurvum alkaliphilum]QGT99579.1 hypothetical protein SYNTR_0986 [Candidatus Syntrophocurvum alkaliphilum]
MTKKRHIHTRLIALIILPLFMLGVLLANPIGADAASNKQITMDKEVIASGTKYATNLYIIDSGKPGPVVLIVGGVHGNEIAGVEAAYKSKEIEINKGKLLVLPEANKRSVEIERRFVPGEEDLNREFPRTSNGNPSGTLATAIWDEVIEEYEIDWLMDLHEGFDYHKNPDTNSVGQTIIYYPARGARTYVLNIADELNKDISREREQFTVIRNPVRGSLARSAAELHEINAFIFESTMRDNLSTRVNYQMTSVNSLLEQLDMI